MNHPANTPVFRFVHPRGINIQFPWIRLRFSPTILVRLAPRFGKDMIFLVTLLTFLNVSVDCGNQKQLRLLYVGCYWFISKISNRPHNDDSFRKLLSVKLIYHPIPMIHSCPVISTQRKQRGWIWNEVPPHLPRDFATRN